MPRRTTNKDTLSHLGASEVAQVLCELLDRHPELREEANDIANRKRG